MRGFFSAFMLVVALGAAFVGYLCVFIVDESHTALVIRFGQIQETVDEPGLKFKWPVDEVTLIDRRVKYLVSRNKKVFVNDERSYEVDAITMYKIVDVQKFREVVSADIFLAESRIETRLDSALRQTYGKRSFQAALSSERAVMMEEIRDQIKGEILELGIEVVDVRISKTDLSEDVLKSTFQNMIQERRAEAEQIRAVGNAESVRIKAEANREAVEMEAKAEKEAKIIRGQAQAERNKIYAQAFSKDPEFFAFYRSMQAYSEGFAGNAEKRDSDGKIIKKGDTMFVLSPDSEFFRYLKNPTGAAPKQ